MQQCALPCYSHHSNTVHVTCCIRCMVCNLHRFTTLSTQRVVHLFQLHLSRQRHMFFVFAGDPVEADALSPILNCARTKDQRVQTLMPVPSTLSFTRIVAQAPAKHGSRVAPACTPAGQALVALQPTPNAALMQSLPPAGMLYKAMTYLLWRILVLCTWQL